MILYTVLLVIRLYKLLQYCKSCGHANKAITTTTTTTTTTTSTTTLVLLLLLQVIGFTNNRFNE